jgi:hypothetical protein
VSSVGIHEDDIMSREKEQRMSYSAFWRKIMASVMSTCERDIWYGRTVRERCVMQLKLAGWE